MLDSSIIKQQILSSIDPSKGQMIDEEELDSLLSKGESLLGLEWYSWLTSVNFELGACPLDIIKKGGINLDAVDKRLDDISYRSSLRS